MEKYSVIFRSLIEKDLRKIPEAIIDRILERSHFIGFGWEIIVFCTKSTHKLNRLSFNTFDIVGMCTVRYSVITSSMASRNDIMKFKTILSCFRAFPNTTIVLLLLVPALVSGGRVRRFGGMLEITGRAEESYLDNRFEAEAFFHQRKVT
jgi:hypothetical protein